MAFAQRVSAIGSDAWRGAHFASNNNAFRISLRGRQTGFAVVDEERATAERSVSDARSRIGVVRGATERAAQWPCFNSARALRSILNIAARVICGSRLRLEAWRRLRKSTRPATPQGMS